jgi:hypothetical protein
MHVLTGEIIELIKKAQIDSHEFDSIVHELMSAKKELFSQRLFGVKASVVDSIVLMDDHMSTYAIIKIADMNKSEHFFHMIASSYIDAGGWKEVRLDYPKISEGNKWKKSRSDFFNFAKYPELPDYDIFWKVYAKLLAHSNTQDYLDKDLSIEIKQGVEWSLYSPANKNYQFSGIDNLLLKENQFIAYGDTYSYNRNLQKILIDNYL